MLVDGIKAGLTEEQCENTKNVVSKYGVTIVCDEEPTKEPDMILPANENCENLKETVSKYGVSVVCED